MRRPESGTTLIEVLIAVTLLSVLTAGIAMALNAGLTATDRTNSRFYQTRQVTNAQRILEAQINNLIPVMAECLVDAGEGRRSPMLFFQGAPAAMRFVSTYSLQEANRGRAQILEFTVIPRPEGGGMRLIVNEWPYVDPQAAGSFCLGMQPDPLTGSLGPAFRPIVPGPASFVLADELAAVRFQFLQRMPYPQPAIWVDRWLDPSWPLGIRILMTPANPEAASVLPMPLAVPVRAKREANVNYFEGFQ